MFFYRHIEYTNKKQIANKNSFGSYLKLSRKSESFISSNKSTMKFKINLIRKFLKSHLKNFRKRNHSKHSRNSYNHKVLENILKEWRLQKSIELSKPLYCILNNKSIKEIIKYRPRNLIQLSSIYGIGEKKLSKYGDEILKLSQ